MKYKESLRDTIKRSVEEANGKERGEGKPVAPPYYTKERKEHEKQERDPKSPHYDPDEAEEEQHTYHGEEGEPDNRYTKSDVNYSIGHENERCGICEHFAQLGPNTCELVKGTIHTNMWCSRYERYE
jgi:hypothetical protein